MEGQANCDHDGDAEHVLDEIQVNIVEIEQTFDQHAVKKVSYQILSN